MKASAREYAPLSNFESKAIKWLWEPFIAYGMVTVLEGDPNVGKSFFAMKLAATVSAGGILPDGQEVDGADVFYISAEDDPSFTIRPRIESMGGDPELVHVQGKFSPFDEEGIKALRREIRRNPASLVIIDTLYSFVPSGTNIFQANEIRVFLAHLSEIAKESGAAFAVIRHLKKSRADKAIYQGVGAIDVIGVARSALLIGVHPDDPDMRVVAHVKHNLSERGNSQGYRLVSRPGSQIPQFKWAGPVNLTAEQLSALPTVPSALEEAVRYLQQELSNGAANAVDLQRKAMTVGIAARTLDRAKKELNVKTSKSGSTWIWSLRRGKDAKDAKS
ncbi:MAG: AAA family ATPase [Xanthobacteraceae bacterium]